MANKTVRSQTYSLKIIFNDKYDVDFYQREYVWQRKQIEDLINDLSTEFLKNWSSNHKLKDTENYDPYFMGEIILSVVDEAKGKAIIDGQQRITTLTLLLIYLVRHFGNLPQFPKDLNDLIYTDHYGEKAFNLDIEERQECMLSLLNTGEYNLKETDSISVKNLVERYSDIEDCWNEQINETNAVSFAYWIKEKIVFSKVETNSDEFAYVIFETMNDRGLSLTQVEMLRSYLLANIDPNKREASMDSFDKLVNKLVNIKLSSKSKAEFEFFKIYFRGHFAEDFTQNKNSNSDFTRIGKEFHRWIRDNEKKLGLNSSEAFEQFIDEMVYFGNKYEYIIKKTQERDAKEYLHLIVNSDYNFTLQPAVILSSIALNDPDEVVDEKIKLVSKYLTKVLTWRTWNHWMIAQNTMEAPVYQFCKQIRNKPLDELKTILASDPLGCPDLDKTIPILNQQIRPRFKVMLSLITEIVARESGESDYLLNKPDMEVEHIWSNHPEEHLDEVTEMEFANVRNTIGDLLVLPKQFNASYNDDPYEEKVQHYYSQNILAQSLNPKKYENNPGFVNFKNRSGIPFKSYESFKKDSISERVELYKTILRWEFDKEE